jgi:hypothetical protein
MTLPTPPLSGEQPLLHGPARYLLTTPSGVGYNPINGELTLTNQRLIFKPDGADGMQRVVLGAAGAATVAFPIRRVAACSEQPMQVQWGKPNVLKLQFDNGGREYFVVHPGPERPAGAWVAALTQAQPTAPDLACERVPALNPGFEQPAGRGARRLLLYWAIAVLAMCSLCAVAALVVNSLGG